MNTMDKIIEVLEILKGHFLYVKLGGSRSLPFIKNPKDYDIIIVSKTAEDRNYCMISYRDKCNPRLLRKEYGLDFHFITIEYEDKFLINSIYPYFALKNDILYTTLKDHLYNQSIDEFLGQEKKIIAAYKYKIENELLNNKKLLYNHKIWYYLYTTLCILKNKKYELTDEQIDIINMLHDRKEEEEEMRKQIIDNLIQEVESWPL